MPSADRRDAYCNSPQAVVQFTRGGWQLNTPIRACARDYIARFLLMCEEHRLNVDLAVSVRLQKSVFSHGSIRP